jgi:hypothetical protein
MPLRASAAPLLRAVQAACHLAGSMVPRTISSLAVVGMSRPMVETKSSCTCSEAMRSEALLRRSCSASISAWRRRSSSLTAASS